MTGTLNTLMVTVPAAIVVAAVYEHVPGGAGPSLPQPMRRTRAMYRCCARTLPPGSLVFGLLAVTVADQTFWQKVWTIKGREVARTFSWASLHRANKGVPRVRPAALHQRPVRSRR